MKWLPLALWALLYLQLTEPAESGFGSAWLSTATSKPCTSSWKGPILPTGTWEGADGAGSISLHTMHPCPREGLPLQCWQEPRAAGSAGTRSPSGQGKVTQAGAQRWDCTSSRALVQPLCLAQTHLLLPHQLTPAQQS